MKQPDYRGARGSNAGDDFHELWALRQALALLDEDFGLTAVTVEGLMAEDESGTPQDTWDGVDCAFYFGGGDINSVEHIEIDQLKYSSANPHDAWTVARLASSSNKKRDNSVMGRLAKAFAGLKEKRPDLVASGDVVLRLVSNQPVDPDVLTALLSSGTPGPDRDTRSSLQSDRDALLAASGLRGHGFEEFVTCLDLSECGSGSRFALEERVLSTISEWTDDDARTAVTDLLRFIRRAMMPEAKGEIITRQSILARLGFSDPSALFPCPSEIKLVERLIPRGEIRIATERMLAGEQRICLHGEGGCGKTTAMQEVESLLPRGSAVLIFDCYGGGRYLDSDAYRHRPTDAFLQLSNDLARLLRSPLLVNRSPDLDYPRVFKKRLEKAAEVVASEANDALLVIVVDAADNSVTAAKTRSPEERSFMHDFVALGDLPVNVRLVVTGRTGRLPTLELPPSFNLIEIMGFERDETAAHVRGVWKEAPDEWIDDFHHLSRGNPRVQRYALDYAGAEPALALDHLRPRGKSLDNVFREQLDHALHKVGRYQDIKAFCAGLVALPRPIPLEYVSTVTELSEPHVRDLCADLAPGVRLTSGLIGFADEDFEHFMRTEAEEQIDSIRARIADQFFSRHKSDAYAATHVAAALLEAGRGTEIIDLINSEQEPTAIGDPVLRREAQLQRLRIAMKVCRETGNDVDAMLTLLIGAEALKTDAAIRSMLVENPDLAAHFARDTSSRIVLRDPDQIENHGPLLFHLIAADALDGDAISVREGYRQLQAWMQRRKENFKEQNEKHPGYGPQGWEIDANDIAAETEAVLRIAGPNAALSGLRRWSPKYIALQVALILSRKLITSGDEELVESCMSVGGVSKPWDLFLLTPLALAGKPVDISRLESSLASLVRRRLVRIDGLRETWREEDPTADYLEMVLTACEVIVSRGGDRASVIPTLEEIASPEVRRRDRLRTSQALLIDLSLRAHTLLERLAGRQPTITTYLVNPPEPPESTPDKEGAQVKKPAGEKKDEIETFLESFVELYDVRAQLLVGTIAPEDRDGFIRKAVSRSHQEDYRLRWEYRLSGIRTRAALSLTRLLVLPDFDRAILMEQARAVLRSGPFDPAETKILESLAVERSLHPQILNTVTTLVKSIEGTRTSAEEKISALIRLARLIVPISYYDAESIFNDAVAVAGEVNAEAIYEIELFAPLVKRAAETMETDRKRAVAHNLAVIVSDAGLRLEGQENFPWGKAAEALTHLDVCVALAAAGRWEDSAIVGRATFLPPILKTALSRRELSGAQIASLSPLLDDLGIELLDRVLAAAKNEAGSTNVKALSEELAREELLRFGQGRREGVCDKLGSLQLGDEPNYWLGRLQEATAFHKRQSASPADSARDNEHLGHHTQAEVKNNDPFSSINWAAHRFISPEEINEVIDQVLTAARASQTFVPVSTILERIGREVAFRDRVPHLESLSRTRSFMVRDREIGHAITRLVEAWGETPAVASWGRDYILRIVTDLLPGLIGYLRYGDSPLTGLLKQSNAPDARVCTTLIEATERHVDSLDAPTVYALVGLIGEFCAPDDAAKVSERYSERLVKRIPITDRDKWELADVPDNPVEGLARYLYALMGDLDLRNRWRAAHAARSLARLGATGTLNHMVELYDRTSEQSYRRPDAPFYWLASRLWLVIALNRIASETPSAARSHAHRLLEIACDEGFPHVIIRSYAKSAVCKLVERGVVTLDAGQLAALNRANTSPIRRKKPPKSHDASFDRYRYEDREGRRFTFNGMDTLPYWYSGAVTSFADLDKEELLDVVERWIVDRWGVRNDPWMWEAEPRKGRLSERALSDGSHSHGSLPVGERFNTHLEWHAMWCAIGELMKTHPLAKLQEDSYRSFESHLGHAALTAPPLWLADLRSMKPLEERFWFAPRGDIDAWIEDVGDYDFLAELQLADDSEAIVVGCQHETRSRNFDLLASVDTALVSPSTAGALSRALQTIDDPHDYRIPPAGDDLEINAPPYRLKGWLNDEYHDLEIDERDPLRYDVRSIQCVPSTEVASTLNLKFIFENQPKWVQADGPSVTFSYESWSDIRWDDYGDRFLYDEEIRSSGWRLRIDKQALARFLNKIGLDLIVEIRIRRKNKGYEYTRHHEKETKEAEFERILLLRRDGTIEAAERRFGSWKTSRP
jgi:hypothetical protein